MPFARLERLKECSIKKAILSVLGHIYFSKLMNRRFNVNECSGDDYLPGIPTTLSILVVARASLWSSSSSENPFGIELLADLRSFVNSMLRYICIENWNGNHQHLIGAGNAPWTSSLLQFQLWHNLLQSSKVCRSHPFRLWQGRRTFFLLSLPFLFWPLRGGFVPLPDFWSTTQMPGDGACEHWTVNWRQQPVWQLLRPRFLLQVFPKSEALVLAHFEV